jgi:pimeloyl-ACP methyl ester carboxylesterase
VPRNWLRTAAIAAAAALALSGCVIQSERPTPTTSTIQAPQQFGSAADFYTQQPQWRSCNSNLECAEILAPLDWGNPSATIRIAMMRTVVRDPIGSLLINPGGPGSSGIAWMLENLESIATSAVRSRYSIVAFDPRGVGDSTPVTCRNSGLKDELLYSHSPYELGSVSDYERSERLLISFARDCISGSGDLLSYVDTRSAARDLDLMRALLGDEQLNYLGYSYGTELGATYAALFPERVGRLVLDGAIDPTISEEQGLIGQADGFERAFRSYLADCLAKSGCPFSGDVDQALAQVAGLMQSIERQPLATGSDRELSIGAAITGVIAALYSESSWQFLTGALAEALTGDGSTLLFFADLYNDREVTGGYRSNLIEANVAINCADARYSSDPEVVWQTMAALAEASPLFGKYFGDPSLSCTGWPALVEREPLDFTAPLANPVLVIGTTGDPATPYSQAVALAKLLQPAVLISFQGEGHTIYGGESRCVNTAVDEYLLRGLVPSANLTC